METKLQDIDITVCADTPEVTRSAKILWGVTLDTRHSHFKIYRSIYEITLFQEDEEGIETETVYNLHDWSVNIEFDTEINWMVVFPERKSISLT